ncbi:MAG: tRNA-guanine transglycosylase [Chloroflexi bacterium]|nr:tRNA-guanine transglycosylase [Anaerolineaceae bacterium]NLI43814.1 tRNA-guanine transglycosylase [Chloroflexota bacterium]HOE35357.1 tRNA-guanine transglycosylase [Anaerolineaceae bacterium]HOT25928.1 tRNA-guanine transglycosylase [Anaerolineaceae bacterium]HQH58354.1 tRNA-guanine transglycosylase [Anaerolineaceae bacterium]
MKTLDVRAHSLSLPAFLPDATYGFVRSLTSADLTEVGVKALMMNAFHLMQKPGSSVVQGLGGLHRMSAWDGIIMTDSGGFQAYSLIRQNAKFGSLGENGIIFRPESSSRKLILTPEKSIQLQFGYGADILICLDDCTHVDAPFQEQQLSVSRTIKWAKRAKAAFQEQLSSRKVDAKDRPLLFGVIQGGGYPELRKICAESLLEIGFDGFGFGGWPLDDQSNLLTDILEYTRSVVPPQFPIHALGIGHPVSVAACYRMGYELFDCAMPTRDARHGRLYALKSPKAVPGKGNDWFGFRYINDEQYMRSHQAVSPGCDCPCCRHYSLAYLSHLYRMQDSAYFRLATQHNLRFMTRLMEQLRNDSQQP